MGLGSLMTATLVIYGVLFDRCKARKRFFLKK